MRRSADVRSFVVRIWWEADQTGPNGGPLWRGRVQDVTSGRTVFFQSMEKLVEFFRFYTMGTQEVMTAEPRSGEEKDE